MGPFCARLRLARTKEAEGLLREELDPVARYAMFLGFAIRSRTVLVEGTTDVGVFLLAAHLERQATGVDLLGEDLAFVAAGHRELGGTRGVIRELVCLRGLARASLLPNGRPRYRFIGLFDNDKSGKLAVKAARELDSTILEYKDVFRLWPVMPLSGNLDPTSLRSTFEQANGDFKALDWELEDLLPEDFIQAFVSDEPYAVLRSVSIRGKVHREWTRDGKARLHRFLRQNALHDDLGAVIEVIKAIRVYLNLG